MIGSRLKYTLKIKKNIVEIKYQMIIGILGWNWKNKANI